MGNDYEYADRQQRIEDAKRILEIDSWNGDNSPAGYFAQYYLDSVDPDRETWFADDNEGW